MRVPSVHFSVHEAEQRMGSSYCTCCVLFLMPEILHDFICQNPVVESVYRYIEIHKVMQD